MTLKVLASALVLSLSLTGCGVTDLARSAADATACKALNSTIDAITNSYQSGVVDSGLITKVDQLAGDQVRALLSTGLAEDLKALIDTMGQSQTAESSKEKVLSLTESIKQRCSDAVASA